MAVANGFGKVVTSGSVFMYDVGDTVNSYRGEPTTNLAGTNAARTIGFHNQGAYGNAGSISDAPEKGPGWKKITVNNRGNNFRIAQFPYTSLTAGITYSYSLEIDMGTTSGYYWRIDGSGGYGAITIQNNKVVTTITPSAGVYAIFLNHNTTGVSGISEVIYYRYYQVEQNSHATQFTEGTRSSTQGLLPIVGDSSINLSNVSFDSNAQIVFDGTDDYISLPNGILQGTGDFTINQIIESTAGNQGGTTFGSYPSSNLQIFYGARFIGMYLGNNSTYLGTSPWSTTLPEFTTSPTMITAVRSGSVLKFYINGELKKTGSSTSTVGTSTTLFRIGSNTGGTERFNGKIFTTHLYNRELSETEVQQNYNKYKTRFNLP